MNINTQVHTSRQFIYGFITLIGLGFMGWFYAQPTHYHRLTSKQLSSLPDTILTHASVIKFDDDGKIASEIVAPILIHYPAKNLSTLEQPTITLYQKQQSPWIIKANHGTAEQGTKIITLLENVEIHQAAGPHNSANHIYTSKIIYYPSRQFATTDQDITFLQPGIKVKSKGMNAYLDQGRIQLLQKAWGKYEKPH